MTKEEIKKKAVEVYPKTDSNSTAMVTVNMVVDVAHEAFEKGAECMQGEIEKDVIGFAVFTSTYFYDSDIDMWAEDDIDFECNPKMLLTTDKLYQIYKQQKPCTESK